jgi:hypothetical protein
VSLLRCGCDPNMRNAQGEAAWVEAIRTSELDIFGIFLDDAPAPAISEEMVLAASCLPVVIRVIILMSSNT